MNQRLHTSAKRQEREQALTQCIRVLKRGGRVVIADCWNVGEYEHLLGDKGMRDAQRTCLAGNISRAKFDEHEPQTFALRPYFARHKAETFPDIRLNQ